MWIIKWEICSVQFMLCNALTFSITKWKGCWLCIFLPCRDRESCIQKLDFTCALLKKHAILAPNYFLSTMATTHNS
ncbi:hypothetical protein TNCV_669451 [Trichonephila clavipes]|nr:hypothetical protein TNCV_669451 [Trichonephila clavipes]